MNCKKRIKCVDVEVCKTCKRCLRDFYRKRKKTKWLKCPSCYSKNRILAPVNTVPISLCIIAKAYMAGRFSYIGYDQEDDCLVRPIYRTGKYSCCWKKEFNWEVKRWYSFEALRKQNITAHPHQLEDVVVSRNAIRGELYEVDLIRKLIPHCKSSIEEAYGDSLCEENAKNFVEESAECPSVALVRVLKDSFKFYTDRFTNKIRLKIGKYKYSITMTDKTSVMANQKKNHPEEEVILITGLLSPFSGSENNSYDPRRCYVTIIGILEIPDNPESEEIE